jgi:hypothetical protein
MYILSPMTYPLMGSLYRQTNSTLSTLLSSVKDLPIDFPVKVKVKLSLCRPGQALRAAVG